jgi:GGDEF domain-containing protein
VPGLARRDELGDLATAFQNMQRIAGRESHIMDLAYRDTSPPFNRALFADTLDKAIADAEAAATPAVLLMDLDHFKYVNDTRTS